MLVKILTICSIVISILCMIKAPTCVQGIQYIWILPLCYVLFLTINKFYRRSYSTPGMATLNIILFMRYSVLPLSIYINNQVNIYARNYLYVDIAILLMVIEILFILISLYFFYPREFIKKSENQVLSIFRKNSNFILIIIFILLIIIITHPSVLGSFSILQGESVYNDINSETSNLIILIYKACLTFTYIYFLAKFKNSKIREMYKVFYSLGWSLIYLLIIYIGQSSISRWYLFISMISIYCMLIDLYPGKRKTISITLVFPVIYILLIASITKNTSFSINSGVKTSIVLNSLFSPTNMDTYFAGPISINNAVGMKLNNTVSVNNLIYDIFNNFPGIATSINKTMVTNHIYNYWIFNSTLRNDQILPLMGQSFSLFGWLFTPLLTIIDVYLIVFLDRKYSTSKDLRSYIYAFSAVWLATAQVLNMTIVLSWFYNIIFPLFVLVFLYLKLTPIRKHNLYKF